MRMLDLRTTLSPEWILGDIFTGLDAPTDVRENETHFAISIDLPGVKRDDLKVEILDQRLIITAERHTLAGETMKFARSFALPKTADTGKVEAAYTDGVLNVMVAKAPEARPRLIPINGTTSGFFEKLLGKKAEENSSEVKVS